MGTIDLAVKHEEEGFFTLGMQDLIQEVVSVPNHAQKLKHDGVDLTPQEHSRQLEQMKQRKQVMLFQAAGSRMHLLLLWRSWRDYVQISKFLDKRLVDVL